jgi:hypothetical protein
MFSTSAEMFYTKTSKKQSLSQKLIVSHLVKKAFVFYWTNSFIIIEFYVPGYNAV